MIISASRRTDIPAFYSDWFINRIKAGYVLARNPMNHAQISKIPLSTSLVDCIVFWTKDPYNMLDKLHILDDMGYPYYFQFTLTPYDRSLEKNLRDKSDIENTLITLSKSISKDRVLWRYDPIVLNDHIDIRYHKQQFSRLCQKFCNYTNSVTISFVDMYAKVKTGSIREIANDEMIELSQFIGETAKRYGLAAKACCEKLDLSLYGIGKASCIDKSTIERVCGYCLGITHDKNQRDGCGCFESVDIGAYNTCLNACVYCYANHSPLSVKRQNSLHNSNGELLIGTVTDGEIVKERKAKSYKPQ